MNFALAGAEARQRKSDRSEIENVGWTREHFVWNRFSSRLAVKPSLSGKPIAVARG
ncbi:hypothetical protein ZHAS_00004157 [Anopheles sinensis]|uniref:Uncharacterized protein n=1 Tax=Anopheles sinensis TaxID=74873 RepID=A0A084VG66_ANOSI|nr:hypothetical protein ZHAS_00004157 [Anopheles sinensis]